MRSLPVKKPPQQPKSPDATPEIPIPVAELTAPGRDPQQAWSGFFSQHHPRPDTVRQTVYALHKAKNYRHVIGLIEAALIEGQSQAWMYDVLAIAMNAEKRPAAEVERVLLSRPDVLPVNYDNEIVAAGYLQMFGCDARALQFFRLASQLDPTSAEPYQQGLKLAAALRDPAGLEWAARGVLRWVWSGDFAAAHRDAEGKAEDLARWLRTEKREADAAKLLQGVSAGKSRDLVVELTWNGEADLDLLIEEPSGSTCSHAQPRTSGGGILVHDGFGPNQNNTYEKYVCPEGFTGEYRLRIRHSGGNLVGKRATLKIVRYQGTPQEISETVVVQIAGAEKSLRTTLAHGRLKDPVRLPAPERPLSERFPSRQRPSIIQQVSGTAESQTEIARWLQSRPQALSALGPGAVGYQPVISTISEGVSLSARAVISGDRRYVRLSLSPMFSGLTDVMTFGFASSSP